MPAQTGLSQLGDALLRGTGDYANIQLRRRQEEERRAQQLADLQNNRLYAEGQFDKQRGLQVSDLQNERQYAEGQTAKGTDRQKDLYQWQARQARIQALKAKGLLSEADALDETKIAAADALDTAESARLGKQKKERDKAAQDYVNTLGRQANDIQAEITETVEALNAIPKAITQPTPSEVDELAQQLAGKEDYKIDEVRQRFKQAAKIQLVNERRTELLLAQEAANGLRDSLTGSRYRMDSITRQLTDMAKQDYFPAGAPPPETTSAAVPMLPSVNEEPDFSSPAQATPEQKRETAAGRGAGANISPPSPSQAQTLQIPAVAPAPQPMTVAPSVPAPARPIVIPAATLAAPARAAPSEPNQFKGGLFGLMERGFGQPEINPADSAAFATTGGAAIRNLAKLPTLADRGVGTLATLALTGEGSMADRGGLETLGNMWADSALSAQQIADESTLRNAPNSFRAQEIRRIRAKLAPLTPRPQRTLGQVFTDPRTQR